MSQFDTASRPIQLPYKRTCDGRSCFRASRFGSGLCKDYPGLPCRGDWLRLSEQPGVTQDKRSPEWGHLQQSLGDCRPVWPHYFQMIQPGVSDHTYMSPDQLLTYQLVPGNESHTLQHCCLSPFPCRPVQEPGLLLDTRRPRAHQWLSATFRVHGSRRLTGKFGDGPDPRVVQNISDQPGYSTLTPGAVHMDPQWHTVAPAPVRIFLNGTGSDQDCCRSCSYKCGLQCYRLLRLRLKQIVPGAISHDVRVARDA